MIVHLASTTKVVQVIVDGAAVPARVWEGETDSGIPVHAFVTRIAVALDRDTSQFEAELLEQRAPTADVAAYPARLIL